MVRQPLKGAGHTALPPFEEPAGKEGRNNKYLPIVSEPDGAASPHGREQ
jgi:hypothetical protein